MLNSLPTITVRHVQEVAADTWTVVHNQRGYPVVDVYTAENGSIQKILPMGVEYMNDNTVNIYFSEARVGFATVVV